LHSKGPQAEVIARALASLEERFGIDPGYFRSYHLFTRRNDVWCSSRQAGEVELPQIVRRGLRIARVFEHSVRPTTNAAQLFGHLVRKNRLELDEHETRLFLAGKTQEIKVAEGVTEGFVVAFYKGYALGIGLLKKDKLKSQVPRSRRVIG
jgi:NOL1/NOP2/fmu family ribosome biogenesis protein